MATNVFLAPPPILSFLNNAGQPNAGGSILTQVGGVNYPTYQDSAGNTALPNPIPLNSRGEISNSSGVSSQLFLAAGVVYTFTQFDANNNQISQAQWVGSSAVLSTDYSSGNLNRTVDSIAALRALSHSSFTRAFVTGYYAAHDGGGGAYQYDASDTTSADNGCTIIVASDGARWKLQYFDSISIKQAGAKIDGATDDTAAINAADLAASNAKVRLTFPGGTAMVNGAVGITRNGCSWQGDGSSISILKSTASTYANNTGMVNATGVNGHYTKGIGFDITNGIFPAGSGNPGNVMWCVGFTNCSQWTFAECAVTGIQAHTIGLAVNEGFDFTIENNYFNMPSPTGAAYNQAINISNAAGAVGRNRVVKNTMIGSGLLSNGSPGVFSQNYVSGWGFGGGLTFGPTANQIELTIAENTCQNSLAVIDINNTAISGIECWTAYSVISKNICNNNSGHGITIGATQTVCTDNICFNNGQGPQGGNGIIAYSTSNANNASQCILSGNNCFDNQGTKTQGYGYYESQGVGFPILYNAVADNNFNGNKTGTMFLAASGATEVLSFRGPQIAISGVAANPGTITSGATASQTVSINGAAMGDTVKVGFSQDLQGVSLFGYVSSAGTVAVYFSNNNGVGSKTLAAGVINILVEKPSNYASLS